MIAIYSSEDLTASDPEFRAAVEQVVAGLPGTTTTVIPYYAAPPRRARQHGRALGRRC